MEKADVADKTGIEASLASAQDAVERARKALESALAERDGLVVDAIDLHGLSWRAVARAARLQHGAIHRILVDAGAPATAK